MTKILEFPYSRIRTEVEVHQAKIIRLPVRYDPFFLPFAFGLMWVHLATAFASLPNGHPGRGV